MWLSLVLLGLLQARRCGLLSFLISVAWSRCMDYWVTSGSAPLYPLFNTQIPWQVHCATCWLLTFPDFPLWMKKHSVWWRRTLLFSATSNRIGFHHFKLLDEIHYSVWARLEAHSLLVWVHWNQPAWKEERGMGICSGRTGGTDGQDASGWLSRGPPWADQHCFICSGIVMFWTGICPWWAITFSICHSSGVVWRVHYNCWLRKKVWDESQLEKTRKKWTCYNVIHILFVTQM